MGIDPEHMPYRSMAKAIPPAFASDLFGQLVRHVLRVRYGVEAVSFAQARLDWPRASRRLRHLLRGAGGESPSQGVETQRVVAHSRPRAEPARAEAPLLSSEVGDVRSGGSAAVRPSHALGPSTRARAQRDLGLTMPWGRLSVRARGDLGFGRRRGQLCLLRTSQVSTDGTLPSSL